MIQIGRTHNKRVINLDLPRLIDTRMLVQASSGAGKSWLLRLLAERVAGQVQTIILDPEGEFATLREMIDLVLVGREGEIAADVRSASLLARKLCELQVSAVIDLYDLSLPDRRRYVRLFLESLMSLPRAMWHPLLILIDECHVFCPERSAGEAESTNAVISLMSQGRKRGFGSVLATQRLSKLHKDAAAECINTLIGRTALDTDLKRAADVLGIAPAQRNTLRQLKDGEFFGVGPAFTHTGVEQFFVDAVRTRHPKAGDRHKIEPPRASEAISQIVAQLADLPKEAEEETRTLEEARKRITQLERELKSRPVQVDQSAIDRAVMQATDELRRELKQSEARRITLAHNLSQIEGLANRIIEFTVDRSDHPASFGKAVVAVAGNTLQVHKNAPTSMMIAPKELDEKLPLDNDYHHAKRPAPTKGADTSLGSGHRKILTVLAQYPDGRTKKQVAILTGYAMGGGAFGNYLSSLRTKGYIEGATGLKITHTGLSALGDYEPLPTGRALVDYWLSNLGKAPRSILDLLVNHHPHRLSKEIIAQQTGYEVNGGAFGNALSKLRTLELITGRGSEAIKAADEFFQ